MACREEGCNFAVATGTMKTSRSGVSCTDPALTSTEIPVMAEAHPIPTDPKFQNLTNQRFGRWIVESFAGYVTYTRNTGESIRSYQWKCRCDCGNMGVVFSGNLKKNGSTSCGCYHRESISERAKTHGLRYTKEYRAWIAIRSRCYDKSGKYYIRYGGRGIKVCQGYLQSAQYFCSSMGPAPSPMHSIDRINNDGNYSCGKCEECIVNGWTANCRWATPKEQLRNTRCNVNLTFNGRTQCLQAWSEELGVEDTLIGERLGRGWTVEQALTLPVGATIRIIPPCSIEGCTGKYKGNGLCEKHTTNERDTFAAPPSDGRQEKRQSNSTRTPVPARAECVRGGRTW